LRAADWLKLPFLKDSQQFDLQFQRQFTNLVQENCAAVRKGEATIALRGCAGKGALFMAKKLTFY
jgi:hypothetical protein